MHDCSDCFLNYVWQFRLTMILLLTVNVISASHPLLSNCYNLATIFQFAAIIECVSSFADLQGYDNNYFRNVPRQDSSCIIAKSHISSFIEISVIQYKIQRTSEIVLSNMQNKQTYTDKKPTPHIHTSDTL